MKKMNLKMGKILFTCPLVCILLALVTVRAAAYADYNYWNSDTDYEVACTGYAWAQVKERLGIELPDDWGNAGTWYINAPSAGYTVGGDAKANALACWSVSNTPPYGHVAFVTGVNTDGSINITEGGSKWPGNDHGVCNRTVKPGQYWPDQGFIYIDTTAPEIAPDSITISNTSSNGFRITFAATDNTEIKKVYAKVWSYYESQEDARKVYGTISGDTATVDVKLEAVGSYCDNFHMICYAEDSSGNGCGYPEESLTVSLYNIWTGDAGSYKARRDAIARSAPRDTVNGYDTRAYTIKAGDKVSAAGSYTENDTKWYRLDSGAFVLAEDFEYYTWYSDISGIMEQFLQQAVYFICGHPVSAASGGYAQADGPGTVFYFNTVSASSPTRIRHTIVFDPNGGYCGTTQRFAYQDSAIGQLPTPTRYGYTFDGWFSSAEGGEQVTAGTVCGGDTTLYAHWTRIVLLQGDCGDDLHFTLWGDGVLEITGSGEMTSHPWTNEYAERVAVATLPETLTCFCEKGFENCTYLHQINIPGMVTELPARLFYGCASLRKVTLPNVVQSIDIAAFSDSGLSEIVLPNAVTSIGDEAFANTCLTELLLPNGIKNLGSSFLSGNLGVKQLVIPAGIEHMGFALSGSGVETVVFQNGMTQVLPDACCGAAALSSVTIPDTVTSIGDDAFLDCSSLKDISLPDSITNIGSYAFARSGLTSLTLPKYVTKLGFALLDDNSGVKSITIPKTLKSANVYVFDAYHNSCYGVFSGSSIETVVFEDGKTEVDDYLFIDCEKLKTVTLPNTIVRIGKDAFYGSSLQTINFPTSLKAIESYAFQNCKNLKQVELPEGLTDIGSSAFSGAGLTGIQIPGTVTIIGEGAFSGTGIKQLTIPAGIESMSGALVDSGVETVVFQSGITQVLPDACSGAAALSSVMIPDTVTSIGDDAFLGCTALKSITLPNSITTIGNYAFARSGLTSLTLPKYLTELGFALLDDNSGVKSITIPKTLKRANTYAYGTYHNNCYGVFSGSSIETVEFEDGKTEVDSYLFIDCKKLKTATLPNTIVSIGADAFLGSSLQEINLPVSLKTIESCAFQNCANLTQIVLPEGLTDIGFNTFSGTGLTSIQIPETVATIGDCAFSETDIYEFSIGNALTDIGYGVCWGCKKLTTVQWNSGKSIPSSAFKECTALKNVVISDDVAMIGGLAFNGCTALKEIHIPASVTEVEQKTFMDCTSLTSISLPVGLKTIGDSAFSNCDALTALTIPNSVTSIGDYLCSECDKLETVALGTGLSAIPEGAFYHCASLNNVVIPYRVGSIGEKAFGNCAKLRSVLIPRMVTSIEGNSFNYPDKLTIYGVAGTYAQTYAVEHFFTFAEKQVQATGVQFMKNSIYIMDGATASVQATVLPVDFTDEVTWRSDDPSVATVDNKGIITAQGQGVTEVYIEIGDVSASCSVTVLPYSPSNMLSIAEPYPGIIASGNLRVRIWCNDERLLQEPVFTSGTDAAVVYQGLTPGYYRIKLENAGFVSNEKEFVLSEDTTVDVPLTRKGNLNGTSDSLGAETSADDMQCLFTYLSTGCREGALKEDEAYFKKIADINEDGAINILDYQALYEIVKHTA